MEDSSATAIGIIILCHFAFMYRICTKYEMCAKVSHVCMLSASITISLLAAC